MKKICVLAAAFFAFLSMQGKSPAKEIYDRIGICTSVDNAQLVKDAGGSYFEVGLSGFCIPEQDDNAFSANLQAAKAAVLPITSTNGYFPGDIRLTGPDADLDRAVRYAEVAMRRAAELGVKTSVLGSGGARRIPEGFSRDEAKAQFIELCKRLGPVAKKNGVTIVIEPLRSQETNFINTVTEALEIAKAVHHPNICVLADLYHMACQGESADDIVKAGKYLRHVHIAEKEARTAPGVKGDDFTPYFAALKKIKYKGNISLECVWKDFRNESASGIKEVRRQLHLVYDK